jgi:hypothetical protein
LNTKQEAESFLPQEEKPGTKLRTPDTRAVTLTEAPRLAHLDQATDLDLATDLDPAMDLAEDRVPLTAQDLVSRVVLATARDQVKQVAPAMDQDRLTPVALPTLQAPVALLREVHQRRAATQALPKANGSGQNRRANGFGKTPSLAADKFLEEALLEARRVVSETMEAQTVDGPLCQMELKSGRNPLGLAGQAAQPNKEVAHKCPKTLTDQGASTSLAAPEEEVAPMAKVVTLSPATLAIATL